MYQDFLFFQRNLLFWFFVMMDLLKRLLFKGSKLFSNQKLKRDFVTQGDDANTWRIIPQRLLLQEYFSLGGWSVNKQRANCLAGS